MQINITGQIPAGLATKIKEVAAEFDLVVDDESSTPGEIQLEFSEVGSTPNVHMAGEGCTSCEG